MTHEGRMTRGEENFKNGLLENEDTKYFLKNKEVSKEEKKTKSKEKE